MTIAASLPAKEQHKCNGCGKLGFKFQRYSSIAIDETCPEDDLHACSDACMKVIQWKLGSGEYVMPKLRATPGYFVVSKPRRGY
jgi:hypothetical protein